MNSFTPPAGQSTSTAGPSVSTQDPFRPEEAASSADLPLQPDASVTPTRIQFSIRLRFNPIRNLTPELLSQYLDSFRLGFLRNAALTWDAMERRDSRLQTVAPKRKKSVSRHGWEILTVDDSPEAAAQKAFLEYFYNHLSVITALEPDEEGEMSLLMRQMMDAVGKRYAIHEIVWQPQADGNLTAKFIFCPLWWFEGTQGKLRFLLNEFAIYGVDMEPGGWLVTVGDGIMEACSVAYIFKHLPMRDWLAFSEKFGTPGVTGETPAAKDSTEWNAMVDAVSSFSADWSAVFNTGGKISLIEANGKGDQPFKPLVDMMNEEMTRLWRGSDLGTSSKKDGVGASLQGDESDILEVDDAVMLTETLERKVSKFARQWKFGDAPSLAYIKIKVPEADNTELDLKIDQFLIDNNFPISRSSAGQRYGRELPAKTDDLLAPIATPPPAPAFDEDSSIANDQRTDASDKLIQRGKQAFAAAVQEDLSHVLSRLNDILNIQDGELFLKKLQQFAADYPAFKKDILADPAAARALQPILGAALANGLATSNPEMANGDVPGHEFHGNQFTGGGSGGRPVMAHSIDDVVKDGQTPDKKSFHNYGTVKPDIANQIKKDGGPDIEGYEHRIEADTVRKVLADHGGDHLPVQKEDFAKLPEIVNSPDKVSVSGQKTKGGLQAVQYEKRFNGTTIVVEEVRTGHGKLALKTMYKRPSRAQ
jgi:hypothetical protein